MTEVPPPLARASIFVDDTDHNFNGADMVGLRAVAVDFTRPAKATHGSARRQGMDRQE